MKTLLFLLLIVSGACFGQSAFSTTTPQPDSTVFRTLIAISFAPIIPKDSTWTDKEIWEMMKINGHTTTIEEYDHMVDNFKFVPLKGQKVVHIRFQINGRKTDYTFEEFRKILFD